MTIVIESYAIEEGGRIYSDSCAYTVGEEDSTVRDGNHARDIVRKFCGVSSSGEQSPVHDGRPPASSRPIMRIFISVANTRRGVSRYRMDYRRYEFGMAYNSAVSAMMDVYHALKRIFRAATKSLRMAQ